MKETEKETRLDLVTDTLMRIWTELLGIPNIDLDDSFFDIGGNSTLLMELYFNINQNFTESISIPDLFAYPTIRKLAAYLNHKNGGLR